MESTRNQVLLSVRSASKIYHMGEVDVPALRDASVDIFDSDFLVIVGPSGSGKSTLLNLIGGMDRPTSGSVRFLDQELSNASDHELTMYRRRQVGFVFQFYNLVPTLTALENVQVAADLSPDPIQPTKALELVDLADRADHFPSQLSGGQQQRVSVARALAGNPRILLCDEPTGALDVEMGRQVLMLLDKLNSELGKTVVLITHNGAIAAMARRSALIRDGVIVSVTTNDKPMPVDQIKW